MNQTVSLQDAEYRNFASGSPPSVAFTSTTEVGFIQLDLPVEQGLGIFRVAQNGQPDSRNSPVDGSIRYVQLQSHLPNGDFQFKELDEGHPLNIGQTTLINPPTGEIMEGIITVRTTVSSLFQFVKLSLSTAWAKSLMVFEAFSQQIFSAPVSCPNNPDHLSQPKIRIFLIVNHCTILYSPLCEQDLRHIHPFAKGDTNDEEW
jgi:hypothetical protein